jgi:hypothetical protein
LGILQEEYKKTKIIVSRLDEDTLRRDEYYTDKRRFEESKLVPKK